MRPLAAACLLAALFAVGACDRQAADQTRADAHRTASDVKADVDTVAHDPTVEKVGAEAKKLGHEAGVELNKGADKAHEAGRKVAADVHSKS